MTLTSTLTHDAGESQRLAWSRLDNLQQSRRLGRITEEKKYPFILALQQSGGQIAIVNI